MAMWLSGQPKRQTSPQVTADNGTELAAVKNGDEHVGAEGAGGTGEGRAGGGEGEGGPRRRAQEARGGARRRRGGGRGGWG